MTLIPIYIPAEGKPGRPTAAPSHWPYAHKTAEQADRSQSHPLTGRSNGRVA